jgi:hypothetical protein
MERPTAARTHSGHTDCSLQQTIPKAADDDDDGGGGRNRGVTAGGNGKEQIGVIHFLWVGPNVRIGRRAKIIISVIGCVGC